MKRSLYGLILVFGLSCINKNKAPRGIMERAAMQKILWDMIQADQYASEFLNKDSTSYNIQARTAHLYADVFRIHHISADEFDKSFRYYLSRPDITKIIFDSLAIQANLQRKDLYSTSGATKKPLVPPKMITSPVR